jgi:hypothetical protein
MQGRVSTGQWTSAFPKGGDQLSLFWTFKHITREKEFNPKDHQGKKNGGWCTWSTSVGWEKTTDFTLSERIDFQRRKAYGPVMRTDYFLPVDTNPFVWHSQNETRYTDWY